MSEAKEQQAGLATQSVQGEGLTVLVAQGEVRKWQWFREQSGKLRLRFRTVNAPQEQDRDSKQGSGKRSYR